MDEDQNVEVAASAPAGNNKKMMILIVGLLLVLIAVVVAVAIYILSVLGQEQQPTIVDPHILTPGVEDITFISIGHPINTNLLTGADGRNMAITLNFNIGVNHSLDTAEETIELISNAEPVVRSIALSVLRDMTAFEVNSREGATQVANEIQRRLQEEFRTNLITGVYVIDIFTAPTG